MLESIASLELEAARLGVTSIAVTRPAGQSWLVSVSGRNLSHRASADSMAKALTQALRGLSIKQKATL